MDGKLRCAPWLALSVSYLRLPIERGLGMGAPSRAGRLRGRIVWDRPGAPVEKVHGEIGGDGHIDGKRVGARAPNDLYGRGEMSEEMVCAPCRPRASQVPPVEARALMQA